MIDAGEAVVSNPSAVPSSIADALGMLLSCPGDEGTLVGGVSDARFTLSFETIDWSAADALDSEAVSVSDGRATSGLVSNTCVEFARGGRGGGTDAAGGRDGCGVLGSFSNGGGTESWSLPVKPVCDTGAGSLCGVLAFALPGFWFFHNRYTLCSGAFFCSC